MNQKATPHDIITALPSAPITQERELFTDWKNLKQAGVARVNIAPTENRPNGATEYGYSKRHARQTVLQQHCDFFDLKSDGILTPYGTYIAFRLLQWSIFMSVFGVLVIHGAFSYLTLPPGRWYPDLLFRIYLDNIHVAKHGSDTATYDNEGRFRPQQFSDFFTRFGSQLTDGEYGITYRQALKGAWGQRCAMDAFGVSAGVFEWTATYLTLWPVDGIMRMEDIRGVYDGSYFYKVGGIRRERYLASKK